ncbi:SLC13 family permease [Microbacterium sp. P06]|uniref:SLC13 family permease n=1 Tax=Microbacterium sp. P06 TaxID=3366949 RepID=UPI0037471C4F
MDAVKLAIVGLVLLVAGGAGLVAGVLPVDDALRIADRIWPILLFVVAVTVVAELAAAAGVFDVIAAALARLARGRARALWVLTVLLAVFVTAFLSLDTTAVLLTPVVIALARRHRLDPVPFVFVTVVLANTASLALPVSNLTNLLAADVLGTHDPVTFLALVGPSALVAVLVSVAVLSVVLLPRVPARFDAAPPPGVADRPLLVTAAVVTGLLLPALVIGLPPWLPAGVAAVILIAVFSRRSPRTLRIAMVPWQLVVFASGLFLAVGVLEAMGSGAVLASAVGGGDDLLSLWQVAGVGALAANVGNNLPAYLALESTAGSPTRLAALLVGVNAGPLLTPWASLATLLWHDRLRAQGIEISWRRFVVLGFLIGPLTVAAAVVPLALQSGP